MAGAAQGARLLRLTRPPVKAPPLPLEGIGWRSPSGNPHPLPAPKGEGKPKRPAPRYLCPDFPGISPRFGTSFGPWGALPALRLAGSNPFAFGNGFSPAIAGFPVFFVGMICPCVQMDISRARPRRRTALGRNRLVHFQGTPMAKGCIRPHLSARVGCPLGGRQTVSSMTRTLLCQNQHYATSAPA